ncbi:MAG TPA: hypothetical protein VKV16_08705, partial [Solirubrobacteraceae bacterium]|nr:hypothetical protein [Solirubrobacteraceae bacterium]
MLRYVLWRLLGALAVFASFALLAWFLHGGPGRLLRGGAGEELGVSTLAAGLVRAIDALWSARTLLDGPVARLCSLLGCGLAMAFAAARLRARARRRYVRLRVEAYRADHADVAAVAEMFAALH